MTTETWIAFPYDRAEYTYAGDALEKNWARLHRGDQEPYPSAAFLEARCADHPQAIESIVDFDGDFAGLAERLQDAWTAYHCGDFGAGIQRGMKLGVLGSTVANKAAGIYAESIEEDETRALRLFDEAGTRAEQAIAVLPDDPNAYYFHAMNLGRYSQRISIVKALADGIGGKVKASLDQAIDLQPKHAEAHTALGLYHAEIIDKIGAMVGSLTYGASKEAALKHFQTAIELHPESAIAKIEYANGLLMLYGDKKMDQAVGLYEQAAECTPVDAMERLDVEQAKVELE